MRNRSMVNLVGGLAALLAAGLVEAQSTTRSAGRVGTAETQQTFTNPLYRGADPWVTRHEGMYYFCSAGGRRISVYKSATLTDRGEGKTVWRAPQLGWNTQQIWAPELHRIRGKWYIYYAASQGENSSHRMGVLEATGDDPQGGYLDRGMLYTGDDIEHKRNNRWAIDGTAFELGGKLYFVWSGWTDERDIQHLFIARMENPWTIGGNRVRIADNDTYGWERVGENRRERGLHEGPAVLIRNGRVIIVFSCSGSWQQTYKLGLLHADAKADLLDARSWTKLDRPVFQSAGEVFGVGHCSFTTSPDGKEDWIFYHAKVSREEGWGRVARLQRFTWDQRGLPVFGKPAASGQAIALPSGTAKPAAKAGD